LVKVRSLRCISDLSTTQIKKEIKKEGKREGRKEVEKYRG
jgi:hypothetical protein